MTNFVRNDGADIAYHVDGHGPLLVLIPGGNGDSARLQPLMNHLTTYYTVVRVDRSAAGFSSGAAEAELDLAEAAGDIAAVIRAMVERPAIVFGTSGGAIIALKLAEDHPGLIRQLLTHEPPVIEILPDSEANVWREFNQRVYDLFLEWGAEVAMRFFASTMIGFGPAPARPGDQSPTTNHRFLRYEFLQLNRFKPDLDKLRLVRFPITMLIGSQSGDAYYVRTARRMAEHLPSEIKTLPGHHMGYVTEPAEFAASLRAALLA